MDRSHRQPATWPLDSAPAPAYNGGMSHVSLDISLDPDVPALAARGRKASPLVACVVRPLEGADLALLAANRGTAPATLKRLSQRHHGLARSLALGVAPGEAAIIHGYDPSRVSILQGDPAFEDLVAFYADKVDTAFADVTEQLSAVSRDALGVLQERLEESPEDFTNKELLGVAEAGLDRTGYGKTSTQVNVNADLTDRINAARERELAARKAAASEIIDATAEDVTDVEG